MGLFSAFKKKEVKKAEEPKVDMRKVIRDQAKLDALVAYIKENYNTPVINIKTTEAENLTLTDSKFGGMPYWNPEMQYPKSDDGTMLTLLAQFNFGKEKIESEMFPKSGILQFYIMSDDCYGLTFKDDTIQNKFRIVYHETVDESVTEDDVRALGVTPNSELDDSTYGFPLYKAYALEFSEGKDYVNVCLESFEDVVKAGYKELFGEEIEGYSWRFFTNAEYDYLAQELGTGGHKLMGYPFFTQEDPRQSDDEFDTLLFQMDSDCKDILWGDSGVCNFFINGEALKNRDFSRVLYNWDCY